MPSISLAAFQFKYRIAAEDHQSRLFMDVDADHLAEPSVGNFETQDRRNGQPLLFYRLLLLVREVLQSRRLPKTGETEASRASGRRSTGRIARATSMKNVNKPNELEHLYRNRFDAEKSYRVRVWKTLIERFFSRYISPNAVVLDLGCGHGEFINNVQCGKKFAMDLNPDSRRQLDPSVVFLEEDCTKPWSIGDSTLDLVFSSNFFEHLPSKDALSDVLTQASRCLRRDGLLIAMGPNIRFVGGAYWDYWDHHLPLTDSSVVEILRLQGFRIDKAIDRFLPYTMVNARPVPSAVISLYLMFPVVWKIFGKQFLIIAAKA